jgi:hypothetical protein
MNNMNKIKWFVIGFHLYVFPPDPKVGDIEALINWKPEKKGVLETLKFRWHFGIWSYRAVCMGLIGKGFNPKHERIENIIVENN